jgi:integral membrane protein
MYSTVLGWFRFITIIEGISYVLLLGIGMPIKYILDIGEATLILGSIHGLLFVVFVLLLLYVSIQSKWSFFKMAMIFIVSFIPFGNFVIDRKLLKHN